MKRMPPWTKTNGFDAQSCQLQDLLSTKELEGTGMVLPNAAFINILLSLYSTELQG
jgi:hypothetical protein